MPRRLRNYLLILTLALGLATLTVACDPGDSIHYENRTNEKLFVQVNDDGHDPLLAGETVDYGYLATTLGSGDDPFQIKVVDTRGCSVLTVNTTFDRFKKDTGLSLVISPSDLPPVTERVPCGPPPR